MHAACNSPQLLRMYSTLLGVILPHCNFLQESWGIIKHTVEQRLQKAVLCTPRLWWVQNVPLSVLLFGKTTWHISPPTYPMDIGGPKHMMQAHEPHEVLPLPSMPFESKQRRCVGAGSLFPCGQCETWSARDNPPPHSMNEFLTVRSLLPD